MAQLKRRHREPRPLGQATDADAFVGQAAEIEPDQSPTTALVAIDQARRALEVASTLDDVKDIRDRAEAMRAYAKQAQYSLEIQNRCAELKLRAERKAGTLLSESTVKGGARHKSHDGTYERRSVLEDLGISKMQSSRWQTVSTIPDDIFEQHVAKIKASERELTSASVIRIATLLKKKESAQFPQQQPTDRTDQMPDEDSAAGGIGEEFTAAFDVMKQAIDKAKATKWQSTSKEDVLNYLNQLLTMVTAED
ncbi:hypothetical protein ACFL2Q_02185 [Thermodesulfobacteriota bacterium]